MLADQKKLIPSLITFKREIWNAASSKGKMLQHEEKIHKIIIEEYPTCRKMIKKKDDHYCSLQRKEVNPTILNNELWWNTYIQEPKTDKEYR